MASAACYTRVSTPQQNEQMQKHFNEQKAEELGYYPTDILYFDDHGVSALKVPLQHRPAIQNLLSLVLRKAIECVIVYRRDRIARNMEEYLEVYDICMEHGVQLVLSDKYSDPITDDYAKEASLALEAEVEGITIASRTRDMAKFYPPAPYGYDKVGSKGQTHYTFSASGSIELVKQMFAEFCQVTSREAVVQFRHLWRKRLGNRRPEMLLSNPMYAGCLLENGIVIELNHIEPIVDVDVIRDNRIKLDKAGYPYSPPAKTWPSIKFPEIPIKCGRCGSELEYKLKSKVWYYHCSSCKTYYTETERLHGAVEVCVQDLVTGLDESEIQSRTLARLSKFTRSISTEISRLEEVQRALKARIALHISDDPIKTHNGLAQLREFEEELKLDRIRLAKLEQLRRNINGLRLAIRRRITELSNRGTVVQLLISCVVAYPAHIEVLHRFETMYSEVSTDAIR